MKPGLKEAFAERWNKYFPNADLPITFFYTKNPGEIPRPASVEGRRCLINDLEPITQGQSLYFDAKSVICPGGKRYLGFTQKLMPNFEYFLSCGIPGKMEGERYKKTPELVRKQFKTASVPPAPAKNIVFKRWDNLEAKDQPQAVIFFAQPDVLSGLFTLANYDEPRNDAVFCPMGAGCATIVEYPLTESRTKKPRAVLGMFDVSARPYVPKETLTFSLPIKKFKIMVDDMEESFLITPSWAKVRKRIKGPEAPIE